MLSELERVVQLSQEVLAALPTEVEDPGASHPPEALHPKAPRSIPHIRNKHVPADVLARLHTATKEHFDAASTALRSVPRCAGLPGYPDVVKQLRETYIALHAQKVKALVLEIQSRASAVGKKPYANVGALQHADIVTDGGGGRTF